MTRGDLRSTLERIVSSLTEQRIAFALAGGLAASLYRRDIRTTNDIDLVFDGDEPPEAGARAFIEQQGLEARFLRKADLQGGPMFAIKGRRTPVWIVAGRHASDPDALGLDLILRRLPWAPEALKRAQQHRVDFGFGPIPTVTLEDFIVSKSLAVANRSDRFQDLDDLKSVFQADHELDSAYLVARMQALGLALPSQIEKLAPPSLARVSRGIRKRPPGR